MGIDVSKFRLVNITDTCAILNVLSSSCMFGAALRAGVQFYCTGVVEYECLFKPRKRNSDNGDELQKRFREAKQVSKISVYHIEVDDLQNIQLLNSRKRLGKGELSTIAFAMKIQQAVLTDDQKARKLAEEQLTRENSQTTPHLLGWLFFLRHLVDGDKDVVLDEHKKMNRPLGKYFEAMYNEALRCRLMINRH